jgi:N-acetylmuramoyl-L-alanine amidase
MRRLLLGLSLIAASCGTDIASRRDALADLTSRKYRLFPPPLPAAPFRPTAIVLHSTCGLDRTAALAEMTRLGMGVHVLIDADGEAYRLVDLDRPTRAARGLDDVAIHVSVVGGATVEGLLRNPLQLEAAAQIVGRLAERFGIPKSNADVASRRGIFSHKQAKYRFGGLKRNEDKGNMEPGEGFASAVIDGIGGVYVEEKDWVDRAGDGWICVWEGGDLGRRGELTKGRGLTPAPPLPSPPLEMEEVRRLQYVDRGTMTEVRGIVLHFTATPTWARAVEAFERRRLGPSIIVDTDGRAWQVVDRLDDKVAAAAGTNDHCIQIEIVGEDEDALLANDAQLRAVAAVVKALGKARSIPLSNADIDSLRGVYSHGQAKKRWGRSAWMWGVDYDPGERYMKRVLEEAGGAYVPEKHWIGRRSGEWAVSLEEWLP